MSDVGEDRGGALREGSPCRRVCTRPSVKGEEKTTLRAETARDSASGNVASATITERDVSCFPLCEVSGIHGSLVFNFMLGNLIFSFPKGQYKKPISFYFQSTGSMSGMVKLHFLPLEKCKILIH